MTGNEQWKLKGQFFQGEIEVSKSQCNNENKTTRQLRPINKQQYLENELAHWKVTQNENDCSGVRKATIEMRKRGKR